MQDQGSGRLSGYPRARWSVAGMLLAPVRRSRKLSVLQSRHLGEERKLSHSVHRFGVGPRPVPQEPRQATSATAYPVGELSLLKHWM